MSCVEQLEAKNARLREAKRQALVVQAHESQRANNFENENIRLRKLAWSGEAALTQAEETIARLREELEIHARDLNDCGTENVRLREEGARKLLLWVDRIAELKGENARLRQALENLAALDTDWALDLDENMSRARAAARRALKERSNG